MISQDAKAESVGSNEAGDKEILIYEPPSIAEDKLLINTEGD